MHKRPCAYKLPTATTLRNRNHNSLPTYAVHSYNFLKGISIPYTRSHTVENSVRRTVVLCERLFYFFQLREHMTQN